MRLDVRDIKFGNRDIYEKYVDKGVTVLLFVPVLKLLSPRIKPPPRYRDAWALPIELKSQLIGQISNHYSPIYTHPDTKVEKTWKSDAIKMRWKIDWY